jgi:hypothetical protein
VVVVVLAVVLRKARVLRVVPWEMKSPLAGKIALEVVGAVPSVVYLTIAAGVAVEAYARNSVV